MSSQTVAQMRKERNKLRNTIRRSGSDTLGLLNMVTYKVGDKMVTTDRLTMQQRLATNKFSKLDVLNDAISNGDQNERVAAAKERRGMSKAVCKDVQGNANGYFSKDQTFRDLELNTKRRYLRESVL